MARERRGVWVVVAIVVVAIAALVWWGRPAARRGDEAKTKSSATPTSSSSSLAANGPDAPTSTPTTSGASPAPTTNVFSKEAWGSGRDELGRLKANESNPEAPMSLAVGPNGEVVVLDQVNGRLVKLDAKGKVIDTVRTTLSAPQDVAVASDGTTAVLDRLGDRTVQIVGPDGKVVGALPIEGKGVPEGGAVTGVFVDGNDVYVEREHQQLVLVGDTNGVPSSARTEIPGRPTRDGKSFLNAWIDTPPTEAFYVTSTQRDPQVHRFTRQVQLASKVVGLVLLDADRAGVIYVGALDETFDGGTEVTLVCLEPLHGEILGESTLPTSDMPEDTFRTMVVLDGGGVLYAMPTPAGEQILHADCRGG